MRLSPQDIKRIKATWRQELRQSKKQGDYLYKLNSPCVTGVFINVKELSSQYDLWVETRSLHRENAGLVQRRFYTSFGKIDDLGEILQEMKRSTLLKDTVTTDDAIRTFEYEAPNQIYLTPCAIEASAILRFLKFGADAAAAFLQSKEGDWRQWPAYFRGQHRHSFEHWRALVEAQFDREGIRASVTTELAREKLGLIDYGFEDLPVFG